MPLRVIYSSMGQTCAPSSYCWATDRCPPRRATCAWRFPRFARPAARWICCPGRCRRNQPGRLSTSDPRSPWGDPRSSWRTSSAGTVTPIVRSTRARSRVRSGASCRLLLHAAPLPSGATSRPATIAGISASATTAVATDTARSVSRSRGRGGSKIGKPNSYPSRISTSSSLSRKRSPPSRIRTKPSSTTCSSRPLPTPCARSLLTQSTWEPRLVSLPSCIPGDKHSCITPSALCGAGRRTLRRR